MNDKAPMHVCFFHFTKFAIPFDTNYIVGKIGGQGKVIGFAYLATSRAIAFGYKIDDYPFIRYTPHCIKKLHLDGIMGMGMPVKIEEAVLLCETWQKHGFRIISNLEIEFKNKFEFLIGNSEDEPRGYCIGLHIWMVGHNLKPLEGNLLTDNFWAFPHPHKNTVMGDLDIDLCEEKYNPLKIDAQKEVFKLW